MDQLERLRAVGRLEQYSTARHHIKFYLNVSVVATYTLPDTFNPPVKDYVYKACEVLIGQHPILSAVPVGEDTKEPYFARLPQIDLEKSISFQDRAHVVPEGDESDAELEALVNVQHNETFAPLLPFWRLCVLNDTIHGRRFTAAFVYHHAIGDGTSGKAFHKAFLQALHDTGPSLSSGEVKQLVTPPQVPLLPSAEEALPPAVSIPFLVTTLFKENIWSWTDPGLWTGSEVIVPLETQMRHIVFSEFTTSSLKDCCRQKNTTITAALQTSIARALFAHIPDSFTSVQCSGAMSIRRWLDQDIITDDSMGVWVQDYDETYYRDKVAGASFPWDEAQRSRQTIEKVLSLKGKNAGPNLLQYVSDIHQLFLSKVGKPRKSTFEVSNVGVLASKSGQDATKPQIGRMVFSQSASVTGNAIEVSAITGTDGCLVLSFSWQTHVVDVNLMSAVMESVRTELICICSE
ncbi:uncharacterized protein ACLA_097640 [Aspergillus clavatus NRRL 1]|uniref:Alcohol acetyltransferase n=1 Tax=Aspergillus clavatus (strain ATCC 1007 / CBS 513.65 / DSM 816 / NCTC 3887 / NRRL 1 / QM 1276 / 107) TaxID=344612 RepID=A1CMN6_ASPCL|nr:uncharacterized protein ACLA_097640 [Aspergillus clavatus NRRL 1]EAW08823.1 conserved hypothetical protein [Aspergillus clavatus NRRL 1]